MEVSVFGTVTWVIPLSPLNAFSGIAVNVALEKSKSFNLVQPEKAVASTSLSLH